MLENWRMATNHPHFSHETTSSSGRSPHKPAGKSFPLPQSHNPIYDSTCGYLATIMVSSIKDYYDFRCENNWNKGLKSATKGRDIVNLELEQSSFQNDIFSTHFPLKWQAAHPQVKAFPTERELRSAVLLKLCSPPPPTRVCFFQDFY